MNDILALLPEVRHVFLDLCVMADDDGKVTVSERDLSSITGVPKTSLRRIIQHLEESGRLEKGGPTGWSNKNSGSSFIVCKSAFCKVVQPVNNPGPIRISKPGRGELGPYIKSKGYKFTNKSFTDYENAHRWAGNQGDTWQDLCDRFALTEEAFNNANRRENFVPPTLDEAKALYNEHGYHFDIELFYYRYGSNGWKVGKDKMCDLKSAMDYWETLYKKEHPEAFVRQAPKSERELEYEAVMMKLYPRLMSVSYPLTLAQYDHLKAEAMSRNEIPLLVKALAKYNGGDLKYVKVAYDTLCAYLNYEKKIL